MSTPTVPPPYERTEFRGRLLDYATAAACVAVEIKLGYRLTLLQGVGGAPASGGTHLGRNGEGGRAVDMAPWDGDAKERAWRQVAGPAWVRTELPGVWGPHVHTINCFESLTNERGISPAGFAQVGKYLRLEDGLANPPTPDPHPFRSSPPAVFTLDEYRQIMTKHGLDGGPLPTKVTRARDALVEADADLGRAAALLKALPANDEARDELDQIQRQRARIRATLERMPKR